MSSDGKGQRQVRGSGPSHGSGTLRGPSWAARGSRESPGMHCPAPQTAGQGKRGRSAVGQSAGSLCPALLQSCLATASGPAEQGLGKALSLHPQGPDSPGQRQSRSRAQRGAQASPGPLGHGANRRCPRCSPQTQTTSPSRRQAAESLAKGTLRGGRAASLLVPRLPRAGGRQWEELLRGR